MMKTRFFTMIAYFFLLLLPFEVWGQPQIDTPTPPALAPIKVGIPVFGVNSMPYVVARDQGFYREEGLDVAFIVMSSPAAMAATVSGSIEFNVFAGSTLGAAMQGGPVKLVLALARKPKYWIFSAPHIKSVNELAGKSIGVGTRGGGAHVYILFVLEKLGLGGKVQVIPMGGFSARTVMTLLSSGQIAAGYASDSTYFELKDKGYRELINIADYVDDPAAGVGTSDRMIADNSEVVQAFVDGSYRGMLFFRKNRAQSINTMMRYMKLDERQATRTYDLVADSFNGDGTVDYESVRSVLQLRKEILNLPAPVPPPGAVIDNRFAANLSRRFGEAR